jgi:hypothetical protein
MKKSLSEYDNEWILTMSHDEYLRSFFAALEALKPAESYDLSHAIAYQDGTLYALVGMGDVRAKIRLHNLTLIRFEWRTRSLKCGASTCHRSCLLTSAREWLRQEPFAIRRWSAASVNRTPVRAVPSSSRYDGYPLPTATPSPSSHGFRNDEGKWSPLRLPLGMKKVRERPRQEAALDDGDQKRGNDDCGLETCMKLTGCHLVTPLGLGDRAVPE